MLRPKPYDFYVFGVYLHPLAETTAGTKVKNNPDAYAVFARAEIACDVFVHDEFCLKYLSASVKRAKSIAGLIRADYFRPEEKGGMPEELSHGNVKEIQECIHSFEVTLQDEIARLPLFLCEDDKLGNLSVDKLLNGASNGYPLKTKMHLTPLCLSEIDEAGKCLVYERSTAAGFHMLRSVELTIRQYLTSIPVTIPAKRQNWGEYLTLLKDNHAAREVTDHLHNIKDNYRNPLMHPEDTLEMGEAVSLFGIAQSMNEMLVTDMKKRGLIKTQNSTSSTP